MMFTEGMGVGYEEPPENSGCGVVVLFFMVFATISFVVSKI